MVFERLPSWQSAATLFVLYAICAGVSMLAVRKASEKSKTLGLCISIALFFLALVAPLVNICFEVTSYSTVVGMGTALVFGGFAGWRSAQRSRQRNSK